MNRRLGRLTIFVLAVLTAGVLNANTSKHFRRNDSNLKPKKVMVVAHRAAWKKAPENSIKSICDAIDMRVDMIEIDIQRTKDGVFVLMHDSSIDRTTTGKGKVSDYTLAELKEFRLKQEGKPTNEKIPTLEEALNICKGKILVNLDKVNECLDEVMPVIEKTGTARQVVLKGSHSMEKVDKLLGKDRKVIYMPFFRVHDKEKSIAEGKEFSFEEVYPINDQVRMVEIDIRDINSPLLSNEFMEEFQRRNIRVWINTLSVCHPNGCADRDGLRNPDKVWGFMIDRGVSVFQTDEPEFLLKYLREKGLHR